MEFVFDDGRTERDFTAAVGCPDATVADLVEALDAGRGPLVVDGRLVGPELALGECGVVIGAWVARPAASEAADARDRTTLSAVEAWSPHVAVLMMSVSGQERDVLAALRRGAKGHLTKHAEPEDFLEAVRVVAHGGFYLSRDLAAVIRTDPDRASPASRRRR
jgi:DNA-binding NarL/FixJ family response regulator